MVIEGKDYIPNEGENDYTKMWDAYSNVLNYCVGPTQKRQEGECWDSCFYQASAEDEEKCWREGRTDDHLLRRLRDL